MGGVSAKSWAEKGGGHASGRLSGLVLEEERC